MKMRQFQCIADNIDAMQTIAARSDIWDDDAHGDLIKLRQLLLMKYSALPTKMQFVERRVKESGYVTLGRRNKIKRSIMVVT
eukprot:9829737-Ditylum_brightwellii.AAC.1